MSYFCVYNNEKKHDMENGMKYYGPSVIFIHDN